MILKMSHCQDSSCVDGNCPGCKDGELYCKDPRCHPNCPECMIPEHHDFALNSTLIVIFIALAAAFFFTWFIYGPRMIEAHSDDQRAGIVTKDET